LPHRSRGKKTVPAGRNLWLLQIGFLVAQDGVVVEDTVTAREYPTCGVDFLVFYDNWFGAIVSRYNDTGLVCRTIVGQHMADSILYRYVDDSARVLGGDDVKAYKRLTEHDSLWSLAGSLEQWQDQAALERQWQESGGRRPDSSAIETKVLRLGPPPKQ